MSLRIQSSTHSFPDPLTLLGQTFSPQRQQEYTSSPTQTVENLPRAAAVLPIFGLDKSISPHFSEGRLRPLVPAERQLQKAFVKQVYSLERTLYPTSKGKRKAPSRPQPKKAKQKKTVTASASKSAKGKKISFTTKDGKQVSFTAKK